MPPEAEEAGSSGSKTDNGQGTGSQGKQTPPADETKDKKPGASAKGGEEHEDDDSHDVDESKWDAKTKSYIEKLRGEAAKNRKKAKTLEDDVTSLKSQFSNMQTNLKKALGVGDDEELTPEQQVEALSNQNHGLGMQNQIMSIALEKGISGKDAYDYFEHLIAKEIDGLEEDEELSAETIDSVTAKVKKVMGGSMISTSVEGQGDEDGKGDNPPKPGSKDSVTVDQFVAMTTTEKSQLYTKNPDQYSKLMAEARRKRLLVI